MQVVSEPLFKGVEKKYSRESKTQSKSVMNDTETPYTYDVFGGPLDWVSSFTDFTDDFLSTSDTLSPDFDLFEDNL